MGLVYSQSCNQVIDTNLCYTAKPLLELEEARFEQSKKAENDDKKKVEIDIDKKSDKLLDISA